MSQVDWHVMRETKAPRSDAHPAESSAPDPDLVKCNQSVVLTFFEGDNSAAGPRHISFPIIFSKAIF